MHRQTADLSVQLTKIAPATLLAFAQNVLIHVLDLAVLTHVARLSITLQVALVLRVMLEILSHIVYLHHQLLVRLILAIIEILVHFKIVLQSLNMSIHVTLRHAGPMRNAITAYALACLNMKVIHTLAADPNVF